eukprot:UN30069
MKRNTILKVVGVKERRIEVNKCKDNNPWAENVYIGAADFGCMEKHKFHVNDTLLVKSKNLKPVGGGKKFSKNSILRVRAINDINGNVTVSESGQTTNYDIDLIDAFQWLEEHSFDVDDIVVVIENIDVGSDTLEEGQILRITKNAPTEMKAVYRDEPKNTYTIKLEQYGKIKKQFKVGDTVWCWDVFCGIATGRWDYGKVVENHRDFQDPDIKRIYIVGGPTCYLATSEIRTTEEFKEKKTLFLLVTGTMSLVDMSTDIAMIVTWFTLGGIMAYICASFMAFTISVSGMI